VHLFYSPSKNSLAWAMRGLKAPELGLQDKDVLTYLQENPAIYEDKGPMFAAALPISFNVGNKSYRTCSTTRRPLYIAFNGVTHVLFTSWLDYELAITKSNWASVKPEIDLYQNNGMICVPAEAGKVWVVNDPFDSVLVTTTTTPIFTDRFGNYLSNFDVVTGLRENVWTRKIQRQTVLQLLQQMGMRQSLQNQQLRKRQLIN
jgi:hypothetical protein